MGPECVQGVAIRVFAMTLGGLKQLLKMNEQFCPTPARLQPPQWEL